MSSEHHHTQHSHPLGDVNTHRLTLTMRTDDNGGSDPFKALAGGLEAVSAMVRNGIVHAQNESIITGASFHYGLELSFRQGMYLDGEGLLVAVDEDGDIFDIIQRDGSSDDSLDMLPMLDPVAWANAHGGLWDVDDQETRAKLSPEQNKFLEDLADSDK